MATVYQYLVPEMGRPQTSAFPQFKIANGTNAPIAGLYFDATTSESIFFQWKARNFGASATTVTVTIEWYADTASANAVVWSCQMFAITLNTDTQDMETKAFATATNVTDTHLGTTGQRGHTIDCVMTNLDSVTDGDFCMLRLSRLPADGADTMTGDAIVVGVEISYSDT